MADKEITGLIAGTAIADADIFLTRQGADSEDKKVTGTQLQTYTQTGLVIGTDVQAYSAVLAATTASFLTADETKLDGITTAATADAKASEAEIFTGTDDVKFVTPLNLKPQEFITLAVSDETTALTTGTGKITFRMPYAFELSDVRASVTTAPTGSVLTADINETGTTILSTKLTIDATEKTSTTAATAAVISDSTLADDAEITIDIDGIGSTVAGAGLKVTLIGNRT